jgi:MFS superfamily sulfate permease-like transporter
MKLTVSFQLILSFLQLGFLTVYLTEPFISGFTTGAAVHVFSSQIPSIFNVRSPRSPPGALKLPRFYIKLIGSIVNNINWISTAIGFTSIVALYIAKQLNDRFKSTIRVVIPCELILVCSHSNDNSQ